MNDDSDETIETCEMIFKSYLKAHAQGVINALDLAMKTGVPIVIEKNGVIEEIKVTKAILDLTIKSNSSP